MRTQCCRISKISNSVGRNDNFLAKARKLSILPTSLDIFDIRQHYIRIPYKFGGRKVNPFELCTNHLPDNKILKPIQIESICKQQNKHDSRKELFTGKNRNIVGNGDNADYQHLFHFQQCFQKSSFSGLLKVGIAF